MVKLFLTASVALLLAAAGTNWMCCGECRNSAEACAACSPAPAPSCCGEKGDRAGHEGGCSCLLQADAKHEAVHDSSLADARSPERRQSFAVVPSGERCRPPAGIAEQYFFPDSVITEVLRL